jgi:hypothetical protein
MTGADVPTERAEIRSLLVEQIRTLSDRVDGQWHEEFEGDAEQLQLQRLRTLGQLTREYRLLAKDDDIDAMENRVDRLSDTLGLRGDDR